MKNQNHDMICTEEEFWNNLATMCAYLQTSVLSIIFSCGKQLYKHSSLSPSVCLVTFLGAYLLECSLKFMKFFTQNIHLVGRNKIFLIEGHLVNFKVMHGRSGLKFDMLMYPDHLQNLIDINQILVIACWFTKVLLFITM